MPQPTDPTNTNEALLRALKDHARITAGLGDNIATATLGLKGVTGAAQLLGPALSALLGSMNNAIKEQTSLVQVLNLTGKSTNVLGTRMDMAGLSFSQAADVVRSTIQAGLKDNTGNMTKFIGQTRMLGVNMQSMTRLLVDTNDILGMSEEASIGLGARLVETGAQYGIHTNHLVDAISRWISAMAQTQATLGPTMQRNIAEGVAKLTGTFGVGMRAQIESAAATIFGGGKESFVTAQKLGLTQAQLTPRSPQEAADAILQAVRSAGDRVGGGRGTATGFISVPILQKAFGFGPDMVQLSDRLVNLTEAERRTSMEQLAQQQLAGSLMQKVSDVTRPFQISMLRILNAFMPIIRTVGFALEQLTKVLVPEIIVGITALILSSKLGLLGPNAMSRIGNLFTRIPGAGRAVGAIKGMRAAGGLKAFSFANFGTKLLSGVSKVSRFLGPIGWGITAIVGGIQLWKFFSNRAEEQRADMLSESKKLSEFLMKEEGASVRRLAATAQQTVAALDILNSTSLEHLDEAKTGNTNTFQGLKALPIELNNGLAGEFRARK